MIKNINLEVLEKIKKSSLVKRIGVLVTAVAIAFTLAACSNGNTKKGASDVTSPPSITDINTEDNKENLVYDFQFTQRTEIDTNQYEQVNWVDTENLLKQKSDFCHILRWENIESSRNFEIAVYENSNDFGKCYYNIVDKNGLLRNGITYYGGVSCVNEYTSILENEEYNSEKGSDYLYTYTILNHNTGTTKEIKALRLYYANGYMVKYDFEKNDKGSYDSKYQLLYADGTIASDTIYSNFTRDYGNKTNIFLYKDGITEILDTTTGKARKIEGKVESANNNFLVLGNSEGKGIYYLVDIETDLIEKMSFSKEFNTIHFVNRDPNNPTFEFINYDLDKDSMSALYSANGERLSNYYKSIRTWQNNSGYIETTTSADYDNKIAVKNLINIYGVEELSNINAFYLEVIEGTNIIIYKENGQDGKYGLMDTNGNILQKAIYNNLYNHNIIDADGNIEITYFIGRIKDKKITVVLDKDLNEILRGDYGYYNASAKGFDILTQDSSQKKLTLN